MRAEAALRSARRDG